MVTCCHENRNQSYQIIITKGLKFQIQKTHKNIINQAEFILSFKKKINSETLRITCPKDWTFILQFCMLNMEIH